MAVKTQADRINNDINFANSIKSGSHENYSIDTNSFSKGVEPLFSTSHVIYTIKRTKKDADFLKARAKAYFNGSRTPENYETFIGKGKINVTRFDNLTEEEKDKYANKVTEGAKYADLSSTKPKSSKNSDQDKAKVLYYKDKASSFAQSCYNSFTECGIDCDPKNDIWHHYDKTSTKKAICLHYTAGAMASSDCNVLFKKFREGVHYLVGRDGSIYRLFDDKYYSGHLGGFENQKNEDKRLINFAGTTRNNQKTTSSLHNESISIEISNLGYDVEKKEYDNEADFVLSHKYRKKTSYESLPSQQLDAICYLVYYLQQKHSTIPNVWQVDNYSDEQAEAYYECNKSSGIKKANLIQEYYDYGAKFYTINEANNFAGVFTHTDYRYGKQDFPTEIIEKIRNRFREICEIEEDKKFMAAYYLNRCKELQSKNYTNEEITQIVYKEMTARACLPLGDISYTDPNLNNSDENLKYSVQGSQTTDKSDPNEDQSIHQSYQTASDQSCTLGE